MADKKDDNNSEPFVTTPDDAEQIIQTPPDIEEFLAQHGVDKYSYNCQLQRKPEGGGALQILPGGWKDVYPTVDFIGNNHGPGTYVFVFSHRAMNPDTGKQQSVIKKHEIVLGDEWELAFEENVLRRTIKNKNKREAIKEKAKLRAALDGRNETSPGGDGVTSLLEATQTLRTLGVTVGGAPAAPTEGSNNNEMMMFLYKMQIEKDNAASDKWMKLLEIGMPLAVAYFTNKKPASSGDTFKEAMGMVTDIVGLKNALNPEKQTAVDKVFGLMEGVIPHLVQVFAQKGAAGTREEPLAQQALNSDELKDIMGDPEKRTYMAEKLFEKFEHDDCNAIFETLQVPFKMDSAGKLTPINVTQDVTGQAAPEVQNNINSDSLDNPINSNKEPDDIDPLHNPLND